MITSVARENADLAMKALNLGHRTTLEKPALSNPEAERGEEIRTKLRCAYQKPQTRVCLSLDRSFQTRPKNQESRKRNRRGCQLSQIVPNLLSMLSNCRVSTISSLTVSRSGRSPLSEVFSKEFSPKELGKPALFSEDRPSKTEANHLLR
jgi:hypothetical protein